MNKQADSPASQHSRKTPRWADTFYLPYSLICSLQKEKSVGRRSTAFAFFCLLPKHNKIKSRPNPLPHKFTFSSAYTIFQEVTSSRMSAEISDHTGSLQAQGSSRLDWTHSNDSAIALTAFCFPVPSPRRSSSVKMARLQFPIWHMLVPESLTMSTLQECGMVGVGSTIQIAQ